ncbi:26631_t:CDS:2, partial [Dentiscutata erythropus]
MADFQETKLKYRRGTCLSCQKCMYCEIDLQQEKCDCNLSEVPHKNNRTAKKLNTKSLTLVNDDNYEIETCDFTTLASDASESEEKLDLNFNEKGYYKKEYNFNNNESLSISTVDELLSEIHINIETLMGNKLVDPNDYHIAFKSEKAAGVSTQLVDIQDFKKFQANYQKYKSKNINMAFFITFIKSNLKRKIDELEPDNNSDNDIVSDSRNKNSIPKTSNLSSLELSIAKNVLEIRKENHCIIHNQPCLNKNGAKENHIEITFMMLSIWASEINKAMASPTEPPTHPLFTYKHLTKTKTSSRLQS